MTVADARMMLAGAIGTDNQVQGHAVTALGTTIGNNVIDTAHGVKSPQIGDWGIGSEILVEATVMQTLTSDGDATVELGLIQADDIALTTNVDSLGFTGEMPYRELVKGVQVGIAFAAAEPFKPRRFIGVQTIVRGAALTNTSGQFLVWAVLARQSRANIALHAGYEIE